MLFNDFTLLEVLLTITVGLYISTINIMMLLYVGGLYLLLIGVYCFIFDADIYTGFLWVIDLGVGLIFFIFIIHFTDFLHQKATHLVSARHYFFLLGLLIFAITFYYYCGLPHDSTYTNGLHNTWFFRITHMDYYAILFSNEVTDLNTLRETYFLLNAFEFFAVNFSLFFGLIAAILLCFMIQRIFAFMHFSQIKDVKILNYANTGFFIRNQNFNTQQNTSAGVRVWAKNKASTHSMS